MRNRYAKDNQLVHWMPGLEYSSHYCYHYFIFYVIILYLDLVLVLINYSAFSMNDGLKFLSFFP